jgi:antitoxin (DNA-binding transcriptional repressor) of toxin-antitoxin stability system
MKTASVLDLPQGIPAILAWLHEGETVLLLESNGDPVGRIVPEAKPKPLAETDRKSLFASRFAPLERIPDRDLSGLVAENRGER